MSELVNPKFINFIFPSSSLNEVHNFYEKYINLREIKNNEKGKKKIIFYR